MSGDKYHLILTSRPEDCLVSNDVLYAGGGFMEHWLWIFDRSSVPTYTPSDVRLLTAASAADLQNWANRGIIDPVATKPGKGGVRLYGKTQVCFIKIAKWLMPLGIETNSAIALSAKVFKALYKSLTHLARELENDDGTIDRHEMIKGMTNSIAVVRATERRGHAITIHDLRQLRLEDLELNIDGPTVVIPVGTLILQIIKDEKELLLDVDVSAAKKSGKRAAG